MLKTWELLGTRLIINICSFHTSFWMVFIPTPHDNFCSLLTLLAIVVQDLTTACLILMALIMLFYSLPSAASSAWWCSTKSSPLNYSSGASTRSHWGHLLWRSNSVWSQEVQLWPTYSGWNYGHVIWYVYLLFPTINQTYHLILMNHFSADPY